MDPALAVFLAKEATDLAKEFGPDVIKAVWAKINGDDSQDAKIAKIGKKKLKKINELQQMRNDITEYRIRKEAQEDNASGRKPYIDNKYKKQNEKALKNLEKVLEGYYKQYPTLNNLVGNKKFNEAQDTLKGEVKKTEQEAKEASDAILEGKVVNQRNNPNPGGTDQQRFQQYSPEQVSAMNSLLNLGQKGLQNNNFDFGPIEEEARAGFKQKTVPTIAERFTQFGGPGSASAQRSSAFPQLLSQAGADLERSLATMKQNYNLGRESNFANMLNLGLRPQFGHAGPLISGLGAQQQPNIDKFAEYGTNKIVDLVSSLFNKKDQAQQSQSKELSDLKGKLGGSYQALQAIYPEAFKGKVILPESYTPGKVTNMQALKALYPQAFGDSGVGNQTIEDALSGLGQ